MSTVSGNWATSARVVALSKSLAAKVRVPMVSMMCMASPVVVTVVEPVETAEFVSFEPLAQAVVASKSEVSKMNYRGPRPAVSMELFPKIKF